MGAGDNWDSSRLEWAPRRLVGLCIVKMGWFGFVSWWIGLDDENVMNMTHVNL